MQEKRSQTKGNKSTVLRDSVVLSFFDFQRIKKNSQLQTELDEQQREYERMKEQRDKKAEEHRLRIKKYDREIGGKSHLESENERIQRQKDEAILKRAQDILETEDDAVKSMNKMVLYAEIATIRDRQLEEVKKREEISKKKDQKLDVIMEINRLKELKLQEEKEEIRKKQQREGALVIIDQIKYIQQEREKAKEAIRQEGIEMVKKIEKEKEEDRIKQEIQAKKDAEDLKKIMAANEEAIQEKKRRKEEERQLDLKLIAYNKEKARIEEEKFQEKKRIAEEKERELAKLRAKQEKVADNRGEIDAIRARRQFEENERVQREKEARELRIKQERLKDAMKCNQMMILGKQAQLAELAKIEQDEFNKIIKEQIEENKRIAEHERKYHDILLRHNFELRRQIKTKEEKRDLEKRETLEEGRKIKQDKEKYYKRIEEIRQQKLNYLRSLNVKPVYTADLERFKVTDQ